MNVKLTFACWGYDADLQSGVQARKTIAHYYLQCGYSVRSRARNFNHFPIKISTTQEEFNCLAEKIPQCTRRRYRIKLLE